MTWEEFNQLLETAKRLGGAYEAAEDGKSLCLNCRTKIERLQEYILFVDGLRIYPLCADCFKSAYDQSFLLDGPGVYCVWL